MSAPLNPRRREADVGKWALIAGAVILGLTVWLFVELADDAVPGNYLARESAILRAFRDPHDVSRGIGPAWVPSVVRDITALGSVAVLTLLVVLVLGFLLLRRRYRASVLILVATVGGTAIGSGIKAMMGRQRPTIVPHLTDATSLSFPSGHSMMSSIVYLTLAALVGQTVARPREKIYLLFAGTLLTVLVGLSRLYLGVHWPTDVLAGWCAGIAWALLCWSVAWWLQRRGELRGPDDPKPAE